MSFLEEYIELVKKYGVYWDGCGCCGSPFISKVSHWQEFNKDYTVKEQTDEEKTLAVIEKIKRQ